jgi:outer membrane protein assembly factor BamB
MLKTKKRANTACTGQVRAVGRTFGVAAPTADSASGGFIRQVPPLPVPRKERAGQAACRWAADWHNLQKMKKPFGFLILSLLVFLALVIYLLFSLCGILWNVYEFQRSLPSPHHSIEVNKEYKTIWNISDISAKEDSSAPTLIGVSHKIIIEGLDKGSLFGDSIITAIDSNSGKTIWKIPGDNGGTMIANDQVLYSGTDGTITIYANSVETGELLWSKPLPRSHSASDIHFAEKKVFVNDTDGAFSILSEQGEILYNSNEPFGKYLDKYLELNGILFMQNAPLGIKAVEPSSGKELWALEIDTRDAYDPVFDEGEIFTTTNDGSGKIYSIDQAIGKVNWTASQDAVSNLCVMGDKIYFTNPDGYLVAINRYSGIEISKVQFSPKFALEKQIGSYQIACDKANSVLVVSFGDNTQIMGLKIMNP